MKLKLIAALFLLSLWFTHRGLAVDVFIDVASNNLMLDAATGATLTRDVWGDTWFPEWNTTGGTAGYRNDNPDPNPATFSLAGNVLTVTKVIDATGGEDRWDRGALLVFGSDGTQYVRFGMWSSPGKGALKGTTQTLSFTVPSWVQGQIVYEYWTLYGAVNNLNNWFFDPLNHQWLKRDLKSHLARSLGNSGISIASNPPPNPLVDINIVPSANPVSAQISPATQTIPTGGSATFALSESGGAPNGAAITGTDGTNISNVGSSFSVTPAAGSYTYTFNVLGTVHLRWKSIVVDELWLDPPAAASINIGGLSQVDVSSGGAYTVRARLGATWTSQPLVVMAPNTATSTATLTVTSGPVVTAFSPAAASYTVPTGPNAGNTYNRSWQNGGVWTAYLARDGVSFQATGVSAEGSITGFEVQAKTPSGDWYTLTTAGAPASAPSQPVSQNLSARLGEVNPQKPLVPADVSLVGTWTVRARVQDSVGAWSPWAFEQPLAVVMPVKIKTVHAQTLPPVGMEGWFKASPGKDYIFQVLVP